MYIYIYDTYTQPPWSPNPTRFFQMDRWETKALKMAGDGGGNPWAPPDKPWENHGKIYGEMVI